MKSNTNFIFFCILFSHAIVISFAINKPHENTDGATTTCGIIKRNQQQRAHKTNKTKLQNNMSRHHHTQSNTNKICLDTTTRNQAQIRHVSTPPHAIKHKTTCLGHHHTQSNTNKTSHKQLEIKTNRA